MNTDEIPNMHCLPDSEVNDPSEPARAACSAFDADRRRNITQQLNIIETWVRELRMSLVRGGVVECFQVECLSDATRAVMYDVGMLNGHHMAQYDKRNSTLSEPSS
jgi:hypothetical protein